MPRLYCLTKFRNLPKPQNPQTLNPSITHNLNRHPPMFARLACLVFAVVVWAMAVFWHFYSLVGAVVFGAITVYAVV